MLVQRCALDQHRLILPVSISKPIYHAESFVGQFSQQQHRALVDTGAQRTVVSRSVISELNLIRTGHMEFGGLHGRQTHSRYLASIGIWAHRLEDNKSSIDFGASEISVFAIETPFEVVNMDDNANFDLILGFDVLKQFSFSFDHRSKIFELIVKA
jgi:predicted aspartyl protease